MIDFSEMYEDHGDEEYLKFENIKPGRVLSRRPDLNAFLLLDKLVPGKRDIVSSSRHDEFYLDVDIDELDKVATEEDALDLIRCGVRYDFGNECLAMFT